jgi:3-methyladenine DNA glycosylase/8-oxoguanine DNA glycosylase
MPHRLYDIEQPYEFWETTRLLRTGANDPTFIREPNGFWRAQRLPEGLATLHVRCNGVQVAARAWGPGADAALDLVPHLIGLAEDPWELPSHPVTDRLLREHRGLRLTDTRSVFEATVNLILQQLVTWSEAAAGWRRLVETFGEPAPGPRPMLVLPPARRLARTEPNALVACGIGGKRARILVRAAGVAHRLEEIVDMSTKDAWDRLTSVRGIGPWTAASILGMRLGRPEPVILGDYHMPHTVTYAFTGEHRGSDAQMVELLAPFEGQAMRVLRLLHAAGISAPRRGARRQPFRRFS